MIDTNTEQLFPLAKALEFVPGGRPNLATLYRWCFKGVKGVKLETVCIGGARRTSREALERFFQATTKAADAMLATPAGPSEKRQAKVRQVAVDRELVKRGF